MLNTDQSGYMVIRMSEESAEFDNNFMKSVREKRRIKEEDD